MMGIEINPCTPGSLQLNFNHHINHDFEIICALA